MKGKIQNGVWEHCYEEKKKILRTNIIDRDKIIRL